MRALPCLCALILAACGSKEAQPPAAGSAPPPAAGSAPAPREAPAAPGSAAPAAAAEAAPAPAGSAADGSLPAPCAEYRRTIERLATCGDALPAATRESLQQLFERQWTDWGKLPEQDRQSLASICESSAQSVKAAAAAACGW